MLHIVADDLVFAALELADELYGVDWPEFFVDLSLRITLKIFDISITRWRSQYIILLS